MQISRRRGVSSGSPLACALVLIACSSSDESTDGAVAADPSETTSSSVPSTASTTSDSSPAAEPSNTTPTQPATPGPRPAPLVPPNTPMPSNGGSGPGSAGAGGSAMGGASSGGAPSSGGGGDTPSETGGSGGDSSPALGGSAGETAQGGQAMAGGAGEGPGTPSGGVGGAIGGMTSEGGSGGDDGPPPGSGDAPCEVPDFIFEDPSPIGWASQGGTTTGGGDTAPILVTAFDDLANEVEGDTPKVVYVQGDFDPAVLDIGSNKTIIGCSAGAHLRGHIGIGSGSSNVILRNLEISGYGAGNCALDPDYDSGEGCSSGNDAVSVNGDAHHVWFDHCWVKDGTDGNLDITNDANFVTVSWTRFSYTPRTDDEGSDSTGASGHRYSNLVGGSDSEPSGWPETIPLNVTWHHNWWSENVVERQPRVRFGRNHLFNNLYDSGTSNYCVRAGIEASVLLERNYFDGVDTPHEFNNEDDEGTAFIARGEGADANVYDGTSGDQAVGGGGEAFTPPYDYTMDAADAVPDLVRNGAGPR